ncbi:nucleoside triphosphate pyrophosphatase [Corynebacterium sp. HS2168-gen11]|uniref:Maf family protein n=1 Tax=Corynebacterium sp. HS2168-gen11 TaxID=2974027 RepID=UPI00216B3A6B|nr:nucleoside triphosphate pyrophosphatase [Corynebacterium sp. HS2168-gen11]MCS4535868.1 Maf-like protein [Corynebacterium sp. HS2168-gen11]
MRIVLASASPSRKAILESAGITPLIHPADINESALIANLADTPAVDVVAALAHAKATAIASLYPDDCVIGADSMLLIDGQLQGKPHTFETTVERWKYQRGKAAQLITGHCILSPRGTKVATTTTDIHFAAVSDADIEAYARSEEPFGCAGAFTLEALGGWFIDRIEGDPSSVIGLSLPLIRHSLYEFGYNVHEFWNRVDYPTTSTTEK